MEVTEVQIILMECRNEGDDARLRGYATIVLDDCLLIRDLRIVSIPGGMHVGMPSRKVMDRCPGCKAPNHLRAGYCNRCGLALDPTRATAPAAAGATAIEAARRRMYTDVAHPIREECRAMIAAAVLAEYERMQAGAMAASTTEA